VPFFRRLLVPMTVACLCLNISIVAGRSIVAFTLESTAVSCVCPHVADHAACPMHGSPAGLPRCRVRAAHHDPGLPTAALGSLMLPTGVVTIVDASSRDPIVDTSFSPFDRAVPPDPPPPRR
jgi:hypothetical protein